MWSRTASRFKRAELPAVESEMSRRIELRRPSAQTMSKPAPPSDVDRTIQDWSFREYSAICGRFGLTDRTVFVRSLQKSQPPWPSITVTSSYRKPSTCASLSQYTALLIRNCRTPLVNVPPL